MRSYRFCFGKNIFSILVFLYLCLCYCKWRCVDSHIRSRYINSRSDARKCTASRIKMRKYYQLGMKVVGAWKIQVRAVYIAVYITSFFIVFLVGDFLEATFFRRLSTSLNRYCSSCILRTCEQHTRTRRSRIIEIRPQYPLARATLKSRRIDAKSRARDKPTVKRDVTIMYTR